jgi:hypothetical protein
MYTHVTGSMSANVLRRMTAVLRPNSAREASVAETVAGEQCVEHRHEAKDQQADDDKQKVVRGQTPNRPGGTECDVRHHACEEAHGLRSRLGNSSPHSANERTAGGSTGP